MNEPTAIPADQLKFDIDDAPECCTATLGMYLRGAAAVEVGSVVQCRQYRDDAAHRLVLDEDATWRLARS